MTRKKLIYLHNLIYNKYSPSMIITYENDEDVFWSRIDSKEVALPVDVKAHPTEWSLFAFLHEIGHVLTNTEKMKRCYQDFLATEWALKEAKRIGFDVPKEYIDIYQEYIWKWRSTGIKLKGKNMPSKQSLLLST